ncbi:AAA family ATPase [Nakamurella sp. YIM 132087]|uniref:AAA family ATPase n=1 Tax=Nakamurella alba TaxID=2665158 RepID=A0A7K1FMM4_9ACTN|nr:ATP-binding protein [Nakamurella alba]MTD15415.1 AAA family ATPase [Nakamurella alba]
MARLVLICGLPGSGKTTVALRLARELPAIRLSPDEWLHNLGMPSQLPTARERVESLQWQMAQALLRIGTSVILESGFWRRRERDQFRERARQLGAQVELRYLDVPIAELERRLAFRSKGGSVQGSGTTGPISRDEIAAWKAVFEAPDATELALYDTRVTAS